VSAACDSDIGSTLTDITKNPGAGLRAASPGLWLCWEKGNYPERSEYVLASCRETP